MADWASLRHAYGPADDIPALLATASEAGLNAGNVWHELWGRLCHQGTVYSASYAALPALTHVASRAPAAGYMEPLALAAAILGSPTTPEKLRRVREEYRSQVNTLRALGERNLPLAQGGTEFVYAVRTLLALEEPPLWQHELQGLANGELELECPDCDEHLYLPLDSTAFLTRPWPGDEGQAGNPIRPAALECLSARARQVYDLACEHVGDELGTAVLHLFGRASCPECRTEFPIAQDPRG